MEYTERGPLRERKVHPLVLLVLAGLSYLAFVRTTGLRIPCLFHAATGLKCPGCGITHLFEDLSRGAVSAAFWDNPFLFLTLPLLLAAVLYERSKRKKGEPLPRAASAALWGYAGALVLFGVWRNLTGI